MITRRKSSRSYQNTEISLTPLIDTALVLLVIFMVAAPMMKNGIKLDLPKSNINEASYNSKDLEISIEKSGNIYLENKKLTLDNLSKNLTKTLGYKKNQNIIINGDKQAAFDTIIKVVDVVKSVPGVEHVTLSTTRSAAQA